MDCVRRMWVVILFLSMTMALGTGIRCRRDLPICQCRVKNFALLSRRVGPEHPYKPEEQVILIATSSWAMRTSIGLQVVADGNLIKQYIPVIDDNKDCSKKIERVFEFHYPTVKKTWKTFLRPAVFDLIFYIDNSSVTYSFDRSVNCEVTWCILEQIHFHFPPDWKNVITYSIPRDPIEGQDVTFRCVSRDGYPPASRYALRGLGIKVMDGRIIEHVTIYRQGESHRFEHVMAGEYRCQAISYPFDQAVVVTSQRAIIVKPRDLLLFMTDALSSINSLQNNTTSRSRTSRATTDNKLHGSEDSSTDSMVKEEKGRVAEQYPLNSTSVEESPKTIEIDALEKEFLEDEETLRKTTTTKFWEHQTLWYWITSPMPNQEESEP